MANGRVRTVVDKFIWSVENINNNNNMKKEGEVFLLPVQE